MVESSESSDGDATVTRYDALLAGVPLAFLAFYLLAAAVVDSTVVSLSAGAVASTACVADGLFVHGPDDEA